nr:1-acyl-sn-glycerol-3-phosphate acyltransferase [Aestuariivivens sediminis]
MGNVLKSFWLQVIRTYINIGLFFYFKNIIVVKQGAIPKDKPILFLANHQNALLDALLIATTSGRFAYFLTRAGVFKNPMVSKVLHTLRMLPVYRIRDGWSNITQNNAIFNRCTGLLHKGEAVTIFPEGSHSLVRTVRPLSKGFTRIILETLEKHPHTDLQLVPIGFNFKKAEGFPDEVSIYYGEPIAAKAVLGADKNTSAANLKERIHSEISQLTTHIPAHDYEATLKRLESLGVNFLYPKAVNTCMATNFSNVPFKKEKPLGPLKKWINILFICTIIGPYLIWNRMVKPKIVEIEFRSTFRFAMAVTLVPLWLILMGSVLFFMFGWGVTLLYVLLFLILTLVRVKT